MTLHALFGGLGRVVGCSSDETWMFGDLCNRKEAACMLYGAHKAVLSRSLQLRPGRHGHCCCRSNSIPVVLPPLLYKGLQLQHAYRFLVEPPPCS